MRRLLPILVFIILGALVFGDIVFAAEPGRFARFLGVAYADTRLLVIRILQIIWFFAFVGSLGFLIYGTVLYRRADPEDLYEQPHAKRVMFYSAIATGASLLLFIILTVAYIIIERGYRTEPPRTVEEIARGLGTQIVIPESSIRDHYPVRDERNVPRDTSLLITFADPIQKESVLDTTNGVRRDSILIRRSTPTQEGNYAVVTATGVLSVDGTTLKILPTAMLGEPDQRILYTVALTQEVKKQDGTPLFSQKDGGYAWQFEVSGLIDTTPPTVETYLPLANSRNPISIIVPCHRV
ncbi:MAG: Ig-like domain-containing protein, partial [Patescibacteria group bacterium]